MFHGRRAHIVALCLALAVLPAGTAGSIPGVRSYVKSQISYFVRDRTAPMRAEVLRQTLSERRFRSSAEGRKFIRDREGLRLQAYRDPGNTLTIGFGSTGQFAKCLPELKDETHIRKWDAYVLFECEVAQVEAQVNRYVPEDLHRAGYDALVSFVFNVGIGNARRSKVFAHIKAGEYDKAAEAMQKYRFAKGRELRGLIVRRDAEAKMLLKGAPRVPAADKNA